MHADVRTVDPFWTTQTIAGIHGMMVYDTLFSSDADLNPQPQMVGSWEVSDDRMTYTFKLRDGLMFHDGSPVTSKDVVASRSEEHTSELPSLMRTSYAVFCLKKKKIQKSTLYII